MKRTKPTGKTTAKHVRQMTAQELQAVAKAMTAKSPIAKAAKAAKSRLSPDQIKEIERTERRAKAEIARQEFEAAVIAAFTSHGYKNVVPRKTVLTGKLWADKGMRVKDGERPLVVPAPWSNGGGYVLYHASQMVKA